MIKYRTQWDKIEALEIEKETAKTVTIKGRRENKKSDWQNWHNTFEDAKQFLIDNAQKEIDGLRYRLEKAKGKLGNAKGMKAI
jgi:predicted  nucleic acid-binding Zn-ribbon protein